MTENQIEKNWHDIFYSAHDGLKLYARHYPAHGEEARRPLICLPGLTRNSADFHSLATRLSADEEAPRDVYCLDFRGRGLSDFDKNADNYAPYIELLDTLDFLTIMELHDVGILGTSRGGIVAMLMAAVRPAPISTVILNDIGPEIDTTGLARIRSYVGRMPLALNWADATAITRSINEAVFTQLSAADWESFARQIFFEDAQGIPFAAYDKKLSVSLESIDLTKNIPSMWPQFTALSRIPVMLIRGENSDILTDNTAKKMAKQHARLEYLTVKGQGHAPLLWDELTQSKISAFLTRTDFTLQQVLHDGGKNIYVAA